MDNQGVDGDGFLEAGHQDHVGEHAPLRSGCGPRRWIGIAD